ncbi:unnamed protein product [Paramecium sonneborni]|uniref:Transmembrane protein n=1 Tax=Paramecium sonneborni TaxID=65129 RepID=A0A8S1R9S7_9CILI|nr:unnamed protein product [Paramecium sonneborni]
MREQNKRRKQSIINAYKMKCKVKMLMQIFIRLETLKVNRVIFSRVLLIVMAINLQIMILRRKMKLQKLIHYFVDSLSSKDNEIIETFKQNKFIGCFSQHKQYLYNNRIL